MGEFGRRSDEREDDKEENEEENEEVKDDNSFAGEGLSEENTEKSKGKGIFFGRNAKKKESKTLSEPDLKNKDTEESKTGSEEKSVLGTENKTIKECDKENIRKNEIIKDNCKRDNKEIEETKENETIKENKTIKENDSHEDNATEIKRDRKSTRLNSSHTLASRMPSSA